MTVQGGPVVYPCRPGFQPGLVAPVAIRISAAFQAFNVINKLFPAVVAKLVGNPMVMIFFATLTLACATEGQSAFFTRYCAAGTLHEIFDRALLTSAEGCLFFQLGAITFIAYGNDIGHRNPGGINLSFKFEKYSTALNGMSIGKGQGSSAVQGGLAVRLRLVNPGSP
jgi:hypothetical protein